MDVMSDAPGLCDRIVMQGIMTGECRMQTISPFEIMVYPKTKTAPGTNPVILFLRETITQYFTHIAVLRSDRGERNGA